MKQSFKQKKTFINESENFLFLETYCKRQMFST